MGLGGRSYWRRDSDAGDGFFGGARMTLPRPGPAVGGLLIANLVLFVLQSFLPSLEAALAVIPERGMEVWRYFTFQFLHANTIHILFNLLGLYFLGMHLEQTWGSRRFLAFYLACGVVAGLTHVAATFLFHQPAGFPLVGASGGVFAVLAACAILFPHLQVVLLLFPVPIRLAAVILIVLSALFLLSGRESETAHAAHFGGMAAGALWVGLGPRLRRAREEARQKIQRGAWQRRLQREQKEQEEVDRILDKIRREGLHRLSPREKRILQDATEKQRQRDQRAR